MEANKQKKKQQQTVALASETLKGRLYWDWLKTVELNLVIGYKIKVSYIGNKILSNGSAQIILLLVTLVEGISV